MTRIIPQNAVMFKDGLYVVESYVTTGKRLVFKWELFAAEGKCFYDKTIPENYNEEGELKPEAERVYYRYSIMPKDERYVDENIFVVNLQPEFEVVN
jgi:hypothetical protein